MPLIASAAIGAAGSIGGGLIGSKSSKNAAKQAAQKQEAAGKSLEVLSQGQYDQTSDNLNPYLAAGRYGVDSLRTQFMPGGQLAQQFSFDPSQIKNNPNYQFVLQQGTDAVQKSAAAKGGLFSGGTMKALDQYSQGLATQTINDAYAQSLSTFQTNHNNLFQGLTALTGVGENANQQMGQAADLRAKTFEAGTNAYMGQGASLAAGTAGAGNAWSNALQGVTGAAQSVVLPKSQPSDINPYIAQVSNPAYYQTTPDWMNGGGYV